MTTPSKLLGVGVPSATAREICGTVERDIVAAGTNQVTAAPLSATFNIVSVVPVGYGVRLMPSEEGASIFVANESSNPLRVYAYGQDRINDRAVGGFFSVAAGENIQFVGVKRGEWAALGSVLPVGVYVEVAQMGAPGGVATLGPDGLLDGAQSPPAESEIDDTQTAADSTWSSEKIAQELAEAGGDIPVATPTEDGLMAAADKAKLNGIAEGATANETDAYLLDRENHTGTQPADTIEGLATVATSGSYDDLDDIPSYPSAGIPVSTGSAWGTSKTAPTGELVGTSDAQTLTNKTLGAASRESVTTGSTIAINDAAAPFQQIALAANATAAINLSVGVSRSIWLNPGTYTVTWPAGTVLKGFPSTGLPASKWSLITLTGRPSNAAGVAAYVAGEP